MTPTEQPTEVDRVRVGIRTKWDPMLGHHVPDPTRAVVLVLMSDGSVRWDGAL